MGDTPLTPDERALLRKILPDLKRHAMKLGYRFEQTETLTHLEERMIRPDGTVAMIARKPR